MSKTPANVIGKRFGRLVAINSTGKKKNNTFVWNCACDCGNHIEVPVSALQCGNTKSCGCFRVESMRNVGTTNRKPLEDVALTVEFYRYKASAKLRDIEFLLLKEEFASLICEVCIYCGRHPSKVTSTRKSDGSVLYSGIDRLNSTLGYISGNCVPCCKTCNMAKRNFAKEEFLEWAKRAYSHLSEKNWEV